MPMAQPVVTRTRRRIERKQLVLVVTLILVVAGTSFWLGMIFGRKGELPAFPEGGEQPKLPMVSVAPPPPPKAAPAADQPDKLTFYDNLPKGNQAPLGSGINLPPEKVAAPARQAPKTVEQVIKTVDVKVAAKAASAVAAPASSAAGDLIVQVASFRTRDDAQKLVSQLEKYKLSPFIESVDLGEKGTWHRVLTGPYADREVADRAVVLLREEERFSALVKRR
jgi:cell division septation protein DedD